MAQLVERLTSAQVMISQFVSSRLCAESLEPASDSVSPSLSAPPLFVLCLYLSKMNKHKKKSMVLKSEPQAHYYKVQWNGTFISLELDNLLANSVLSPINFLAAFPHEDGKGPF